MNLLPKISHRKHLALVNDYEKTAALVSLLYVSGNEPGILRKKSGKGFTYVMEEKIIKDKPLDEQLQHQLKKVLFSFHPSARNFYGNNDYSGYRTVSTYED